MMSLVNDTSGQAASRLATRSRTRPRVLPPHALEDRVGAVLHGQVEMRLSSPRRGSSRPSSGERSIEWLGEPDPPDGRHGGDAADELREAAPARIRIHVLPMSVISRTPTSASEATSRTISA